MQSIYIISAKRGVKLAYQYIHVSFPKPHNELGQKVVWGQAYDAEYEYSRPYLNVNLTFTYGAPFSQRMLWRANQWYTNYLTWGGRGEDAITKICNNLDWDVILCSKCMPRIISIVKSLNCYCTYSKTWEYFIIAGITPFITPTYTKPRRNCVKSLKTTYYK
jgi:hypothetical protein